MSAVIDASTAGLSNVVEDLSPQAGAAFDMNNFMMHWAKGADIASATALPLLTDGNSFDVTGTTTITSIDAVGIGTVIILRFDGILDLIHHATNLILPTGSTITTAVGDIAMFKEYATGDWECINYQRATGIPLAGGGGLGNVVEDLTPQAGGAFDMNSFMMHWAEGADVASGAALPILTDGNSFDVTGTTTITTIDTVGVGTIIILRFANILILTHHAVNLILPTGASITTAAGDIAMFKEYATGDWECINYERADGTALVDSSTDVTLAGSPNYLTIVGQVITRALINLASHITGILPIANGGTNASSAAGARSALGVDPAGTDNSTDVTLAGSPNYITIAGQVVTRALINLTSHIAGILPVANGGQGANTLTNHGILLGSGTNPVTPTAVMTDGQLLVGASAADPLPKTLSGDAALAASGALTIAADAVTYAKMQNVVADDRILGNIGGAGGVVAELTGAEVVTLMGAANYTTLAYSIDGGGSAITTGIKGTGLRIPFGCTITRATLLAETSGAVVVDIWKDTYANFPPTVADTITASAKPTIAASGVKDEDATLTGWTTAIAADDILYFNIDSVTTITHLTIFLRVVRT